MNLRQKLCLTAAATLVSASAFAAEPWWSGDFETGDLSQWSPGLDIQAGTTDRLVVVQEPVREGRYALRATVKYGDLNNAGARAEVVLRYPMIFREGEERWFHWYTLFPADFVTSPKWMLYTQWHSSGFGVPMGFNLHGETLSFRVMGHLYDQQGKWSEGTLWKGQLTPGRWNEYLLHVKFSDKSDVGFVELWVDGEPVVPKTHHATLDPGDAVYLKQGLYRDRSITWDGTIYHDGMKVYAEDPRPPPAPPAAPPPSVEPELPAADPGPAPVAELAPPAPEGDPSALPSEEIQPVSGGGCGSNAASAAVLMPFPLLGGLRRLIRRRRR